VNDAEHLFFLITGFYLAECTLWVRSAMFVFSCQIGGRQRRVDLRWALLQNYDGGLLFGNLLPLGQASVCQQWPVSLSPQGAYGFVGQAFGAAGRPVQPERFIRYEDILTVQARERRVYVNGVQFAHLPGQSAAALLADTLRELIAKPEAERASAIAQALARHLDPAAVRARLNHFRRLSADLQITDLLLFFHVFVLAPVLVYINSPFPLGIFVGCYLGLVLLNIVQFWSAHRKLYPDEKMERIKHSLVMLLSPADAIHARDKLARQLLGDFSPLAVALVVCSPQQFREFAGEVWRDQEYPLLPLCPTPDPGPRETEAWFRQEMRTQLARFLDEAGLKRDELLVPPPPENADSRSYCQRCLGQYVLVSGTCADCGGRPLQAWYMGDLVANKSP
jgi:hypothetical protein